MTSVTVAGVTKWSAQLSARTHNVDHNSHWRRREMGGRGRVGEGGSAGGGGGKRF